MRCGRWPIRGPGRLRIQAQGQGGGGMVELVLVGVVAGFLAGISPCILPVLPVVLVAGASAPAGTETRTGMPRAGLARSVAVIGGLVLSFSIIVLAGSEILSLLHLPQDALRDAGIALLIVVGLGYLIPPLGMLIERPFARVGIPAERQGRRFRSRPGGRRPVRALCRAGPRRDRSGRGDAPGRADGGHSHRRVRGRDRGAAPGRRCSPGASSPAGSAPSAGEHRRFAASAARAHRDRRGHRVQCLRGAAARRPGLHHRTAGLGQGPQAAQRAHWHSAHLTVQLQLERHHPGELWSGPEFHRDHRLVEHPRRQAAVARRAARQGGARRLLDLLVHQLPADAAPRRGLVPGIRQGRLRRRGRAHP